MLMTMTLVMKLTNNEKLIAAKQSSFVVTAFGGGGGGGRSGQCYIILGEVGWHNCYITLHGEGGVEKMAFFVI